MAKKVKKVNAVHPIKDKQQVAVKKDDKIKFSDKTEVDVKDLANLTEF